MKTHLKKSILNDSMIIKLKIALLIIASCCTIFSCKSTDADNIPNPEGKTLVKFNIVETSFEDVIKVENKSSTNTNLSSSASEIQKSFIVLNDDFYLAAELSQESPIANKNNTISSSTGVNKAATETNVMAPGVKYKMIAYDNTGLYVTERDYVRGQENSTPNLMLDGGKTYTFVIYSINSLTVLPTVTFSNVNNKTLATSSVSVAGNLDFLYALKSLTLTGGVSNEVNVILKHKFSQITTTIDATATGFNVTAITSTINPTIPNASIDLSNGTITRSGTAVNATVTFPTLGTQTIVGTPNILNSVVAGTGTYTIGSITVGPLTQSNINVFTDLSITPGVKYNMKVKIIPTDAFLTYLGQSAVRINGKIWMRHNLGANTTLNADQSPSIAGLHGNYYQWGRILPVASGTATASNANWNGTIIPPNTSWNIGTEAIPLKGVADPCPTGYGIPTNTEFQDLINNTTYSSIGTWTSSATNYSAAIVMSSKRKNGVKITIPAQGWFPASGSNDTPPFTSGALALRGMNGVYHTITTLPVNRIGQAVFSQASSSITIRADDQLSKASNKAIRCIARQ